MPGAHGPPIDVTLREESAPHRRPSSAYAVSVVIITRNRREELLRTLHRLHPLVASREVAEIVVVDNGSADGTAAAVARAFPDVCLLAQDANLGAVGRTVGAQASRCPVVAFADDDSWWEPGALDQAARLFAAHPRLGLLHGRLLVEPERTVDPICSALAAGPRDPALPGPSIMGHLGCGAVVRREAFLDVGGYSALLGFGGEEALLSLDLAERGWAQCYVDTMLAHHEPSPSRDDGPARRARCRRNDTITALLRLPAGHAARESWRFLREAATEPTVRRELPSFVGQLPRVLEERQPVSAQVWDQWTASRTTG